MRRQLIVVFGVPGTGKSTLARRLADELHCFRVDKDFISDNLRALGRDTPADRGLAYSIIDTMIRGTLAEANRVVVEAPLMKQFGYSPGAPHRHPEHFQALAGELGAELKLIQLWCDEGTLHRRIIQRGLERDRDKMSPEGFSAFLEAEPLRMDPSERVQAFDILEICTTSGLDQQLAEALAHVRRKPANPRALIEAWKASFGLKPPIRQGKRGSFSSALWLFAILFWMHRFIAPIQWVKFFIRLRLDNPRADPIPPTVGEVFTLVPIGLLILNLWLVENGKALIPMSFTTLSIVLTLLVIDVVIANLYYLMLRPIVDHNAPHNSYRSFILGWFGFLELTLLLATFWYYAAIHAGADVRFAAIFGQILKGDTGVEAIAAQFPALDVFAKVSFGIMLTIILGRAVSLVPPLPSDVPASGSPR
jgi:predicted kinase